jgi:hypothetical protein
MSSSNNNGYSTDFDDIDDIISEVHKLRVDNLSSPFNFNSKKEHKIQKLLNISDYSTSDIEERTMGENLSKIIMRNRLQKKEEDLLSKKNKKERNFCHNFINFKKYTLNEEYKKKFTLIGNFIIDSVLNEE